MKSWRCKIGWHKWEIREVHQAGPFDDKGYALAAVLERCGCGETRLALSADLPTAWIVPLNKVEQFKFKSKRKE